MREINETSYSTVSIDEINDLAVNDAQALVERSENYYNTQLDTVVDTIKNSDGAYQIILICGPSASGKTTAAHKLKDRLIANGIGSSVVSMDNFFKGIKFYPLRPNGKPDMEAVETMDLDLMNRCMGELIEKGRAKFPIFNFEKQEKEEDAHEIVLNNNDVLILEGIHALNPDILKGIPQEKVFRMYISVRTKFMNGSNCILRPNEIRLIRRMVRDYLFRDYSAVHTIEYWNHVIKSEKTNIDPYRDDVEFKMDTTIDYEVCCWHKLLHNKIDDFIMEDIEEYESMRKITDGLLKFHELDTDLIPKDSLLREFIGESRQF